MATKKHGGLGGNGLGALFQNTTTAPQPRRDQVQEIDVADIQPNRYQPRQEFDEAALAELVESVQRYGVLQPILVRALPLKDGKQTYELIAGERRLRAAKQAGLRQVPTLIREYNDAEISEIALIENLQREDLTPIEEAHGYESLMRDFSLTQEELAARVGRSRSHIANFLRLLRLAPEIQDYLASGTLSMGQAKPLLALDTFERQREAAEYIEEHDLSARQAEELVRRLQENPDLLHEQKESRQRPEPDVFVREAADRLTELLGTAVRIRPGKKKSRIEIEYYSEDDLERILGMIAEQHESTKQSKIEALRKFSQGEKFTV